MCVGVCVCVLSITHHVGLEEHGANVVDHDLVLVGDRRAEAQHSLVLVERKTLRPVGDGRRDI